MADEKLSALVELAATPADGDELLIRDVSEPASDESKRITVANLIAGAGMPADFANLSDAQKTFIMVYGI